jgi:hypothetical protein
LLQTRRSMRQIPARTSRQIRLGQDCPP